MERSEVSCEIPVTGALLEGEIYLPDPHRGIVVFAHGSGSSRHSARNQWVADFLRQEGLGTLLFDLLSDEEGQIDALTAQYRFNIELLAGRLNETADWLVDRQGGKSSIGFFGASTGAAAALIAACQTNQPIAAIVSRGGRPDLANRVLSKVSSPTQLIVGGNDPEVLKLNREAYSQLDCEKELVVIESATHLFEEPGKLAEAASNARRWFLRYM
jgi:dienelactone hydrolase